MPDSQIRIPQDPHNADGEAISNADYAKRLEIAVDSMAHGLCLYDAAGRLTLANRRYFEIYGLNAADIPLGTSFHDVIHHREATGSFTGDPNAYADDIVEKLKSGQSPERAAQLPDGRIIYVTNSPVAGGGWVATHRDVTARVRAEAARDRATTFLDAVFNHVPAIVIVKDAKDLRYRLINKSAEAYFGRPADEIVGRSAYELFDHDHADQVTAYDRQTIMCPDMPDYIGPPLHVTSSRQVVHTKRSVIRDANGEPEYLIAIMEDVTEQTHAAERVAYMARHDSLTGLGNRIAVTEKINELTLRDSASRTPFNLLLLDLDHFKTVNDSLGHPTGDSLLRAAASRIAQCVGPNDMVVRLNGDEFAILQDAPDNQREAAILLATKIRTSVLDPFEIEGQQLIIGTSVGIALAPAHGEDADELIRCADLALYRAKFSGRNQYCFFERAMQQDINSRRMLELDLRQAIKDGEFELYYQPIVNALSQEICGAEALLRWNSPTRGIVSPAEFVPVAEETGLIVPLGDWVVRRACADAMAWPAKTKVAVNLSAVQFSKADLIGLVSLALDETGLEPSRLEIEVTESVLLQKSQDNIATLHALQGLGVSIVLDDFGTGYSSLSYLTMFPFDKIKIDRSFVAGMTNRMDCAAIVCAVAGLGRSMNIATTAEGIETNEQFTLVRAVGCSQVQGYLFGRPMTAAGLTEACQRNVPPVGVAAAILPSNQNLALGHPLPNVGAIPYPRQIA